jgi:predicted MPP superfamily phosphohydrolase
MKKIIAIGDIHGRTVWKNIVQQHEDADRIIFVGDYFDAPWEKRQLGSFGVEELSNFNEILKFKFNRSDQVVLLFGNHDYHYLPGLQTSGCSGFQLQMRPLISRVLQKAINRNAIKWVHQEDGYLFSHAGVTQKWMALAGVEDVEEINGLDAEKFDYNSEYDFSGYGQSEYQTPIWVRPDSLIANRYVGCMQVVGHTPQQNGIESVDGVHFIDGLSKGQYLMILNGVPHRMQINLETVEI